MNNPVFKWADAHPRLAAWLVLSVGMVGMLLYFGRDVGLTAFNWVSLVIATVLTAGACIWIISWEDEEEAAEADSSDVDVSGAGEADPV
ncbi:MAG: hypothetical protein AAFQ07_08915 [Chloroflexota bacterium]